MRVTTIRFNLKFFNANGEEEVVRTLDDLRDKFNLSDMYEYFKAGDLSRWLRGLGESSMADQVDSLKNVSDRRQSLERLCNALGLPIPKETIADYCNMLDRQKKMKGSRREQERQKCASNLAPKKAHFKVKNLLGNYPTRDIRDMEATRGYLAELMERHDENEMRLVLYKVIEKCIAPRFIREDSPPIVLLALLGNKAWRDFFERFFEVKATIHVRGGNCRKMIISVFPRDMSNAQLQGKGDFEFDNYFPRYFPIYGFDYDIMGNSFVAESQAVENLIYNGEHIYGGGNRCHNDPLVLEARDVNTWREEYVVPRWGTAVPSWEERKAETEEMLKQWMQKHFYWN